MADQGVRYDGAAMPALPPSAVSILQHNRQGGPLCDPPDVKDQRAGLIVLGPYTDCQSSQAGVFLGAGQVYRFGQHKGQYQHQHQGEQVMFGDHELYSIREEEYSSTWERLPSQRAQEASKCSNPNQ